jgi:hypothetical protein
VLAVASSTGRDRRLGGSSMARKDMVAMPRANDRKHPPGMLRQASLRLNAGGQGGLHRSGPRGWDGLGCPPAVRQPPEHGLCDRQGWEDRL